MYNIYKFNKEEHNEGKNIISYTWARKSYINGCKIMLFSSWSWPNEENLTPDSVDKFLNMLISIGHESPLEHVSFTFAVEGISGEHVLIK